MARLQPFGKLQQSLRRRRETTQPADQPCSSSRGEGRHHLEGAAGVKPLLIELYLPGDATNPPSLGSLLSKVCGDPDLE